MKQLDIRSCQPPKPNDKPANKAHPVDYRTLNQTPEYQLVQTFVINETSLDKIKDNQLHDLLIEAKVHYANFQNIEENSALLEARRGSMSAVPPAVIQSVVLKPCPAVKIYTVLTLRKYPLRYHGRPAKH